MAMILEVLDGRTGEVRVRRRLEGGPVTLGRGYDNDIVLDDPYVDVRHARIGLDEAGALVIDDLGSRNALVAPDATRQTRIALRPGTEIRVGRTRLRVRDSDAPLPPALPDPAASRGYFRVPSWARTWRGQLGVVAAATGAVAWAVWLGSYGESAASDTVAAALVFLVMAALWAGIWAVASRVVVHRFRFLGHLAVLSAVTLAVLMVAAASEWGAFLLPDNVVGGPLTVLVGLLLVATLVAGHLALGSGMSLRRRWTAGLIAAAAIFAVSGLVTLAGDGSFSDVPEFSGMLKPVPARWVPARDLEQFGRVASDLKQQVDDLAAGPR